MIWWVIDEKGTQEGIKVFNRRAQGAEHPVFDSLGNLYCTASGDLWKGTIQVGDFPETPFVLFAERIWPLAYKETSDGNSSSLGVREIIPLPTQIVLELSRHGGSGWGNIVRVPNENAYEKHLALQWDELEDCPSSSCSAISPDGKHAAIYLRSSKRWFDVDITSGDLEALPLR
ncbi:hypothetical protein JIN85_08235 [Luteolibacter pohnpeiensis]|uniref:Uncharacterized protein n=1 Tax=Luteolibacter pohnpeiensis TaxID=454153 RepID=A0A934SAM7_9BACT|nr:hypothetical protein [Luteolibacter pohnpeiensis]MBK1882399.1 hypothetical protein [Luteolibacter pohnpeiensis]